MLNVVKKKYKMLIQREKYLSAGVHIGMTFKTADMKRFIYKIRPEGLAVLNIGMLDQRIRYAANILAPMENILVVSRKENGKKPVEEFAKAVGAKAIAGRFMPGSLTNPTFREFFEPDIVILTDPGADKQVLDEAVQMRIPIISLVDTFNLTSFIDLILPCNNKGRQSIALIYWLLAREVCRLRKKKFKANYEDFLGEEREKKGI